MATTRASTNAAFLKSDINELFHRSTSYGNETGTLPNGIFEPGSDHMNRFQSGDVKVLVIGAGGLGCEILKNLALSGITSIHVVDLDTIDVSNLNRQFLFRQHDVGRGKAEVAAEFIMQRVPGCIVTPYKCDIRTLDETFYKQFKVIVSGLDNIDARRWINSLLHNIVDFYDEDGQLTEDSYNTIIPLVDGGTEGFRGQSRVIIPKITSCFECTLSTFPKQERYPLCTIAETPRLPEHCIAYAFIIEWPKIFPTKTLDKDSPEDMQWVYNVALERANRYNIDGVTYFKTLGVVKNVIPAVASTNAIISAACVVEVIKLLTFCSQSLNNYFMYGGAEGIYSSTYSIDQIEHCLVCSGHTSRLTIDKDMLLSEFLQLLHDSPNYGFVLPNVSLNVEPNRNLYFRVPAQLELALRPNLSMHMHQLMQHGQCITVTDKSVYQHVEIQVYFEE